MDDAQREFVRARADGRCEYCRAHQRYYPDYTFHVEHIVARQHRGSDDSDNLALANTDVRVQIRRQIARLENDAS